MPADRRPPAFTFRFLIALADSCKIANLTGQEAKVLLAMLRYAKGEDGTLFPSVETLSKATGLTTRNVKKVRRGLIEKKLMVTLDGRGGQGRAAFVQLLVPETVSTDDTLSSPETVSKSNSETVSKGLTNGVHFPQETVSTDDTPTDEREQIKKNKPPHNTPGKGESVGEVCGSYQEYMEATIQGQPSVRRLKITDAQVKAIADAYPKQTLIRCAHKAIKEAILRIAREPNAPPDPAAWLLGMTKLYAQHRAYRRSQFTPNAEKWFAGDGYRDYHPKTGLFLDGE